MNNDLISRAYLLDLAEKQNNLLDGGDVRNAPSVDAVEVVRCKDCIYAAEDPIIEGAYSCWILANGYCVSANSFCSYGKRREDTACDACDLTRYTETEETK